MKRPIQAGIRLRDEEPPEGSEIAAALREAASHWPSGVAVVAVRDGADFEAITVTSFITVSLAPPLVLASVNRHAAIVPLLEEARRFGVSFLGAGQARSASVIADRMPTMRTLFTADAEPLLKDAPHGLVCALEDVHPAGDHLLCIARVERVVEGAAAAPLVHYRRSYRKLEGDA